MIKRPKVLPDLLITLPVILLLSLGVLVIYSSDPRLAIQQIVFALIGLLIYWFISLVDFQSYNNYTKYLYIGVLALLLIVFIVGIETRGSLRWIQVVGINLQPSELAKPVLILFLAKFWSSSRANWLNIFKSFLFIVPLLGLVFKQPDLGTALTLLMIWLVMLVGANISAVKLAIMGFVSLIFMPVAWIFLQDYQKSRILSFFSPFNDPLGSGYNVIQSTIAVGSGEILGRGLGRGTQSRLQFLPEFRTDFIFASIAEEWGFLGCFVILSLYMYLLVFFLRLASQIDDNFSFLIIIGVFSMLLFQVFVNVGMNIGIVPITGITLPLISYGGSSLIVTFVCLGLVASVAKARARIDTEAY